MQVSSILFNLLIVIVLVGNKCDDYMNEQVTDAEGEKLAKENNAIFSKTSAKASIGIDELFIKIGKIFINPNSEGANFSKKEELIQKTEKLTVQNQKKKKKCC